MILLPGVARPKENKQSVKPVPAIQWKHMEANMSCASGACETLSVAWDEYAQGQGWV